MSEYIITCDEETASWIGNDVDSMRPIVRCSDCDFSHEDELGNLRCHGPLTEPWDYYNDEPSDGVKVKPSGFCAWGEPKEGSA